MPAVTYKIIPRFSKYRIGDDGSIWSFRRGRWKQLNAVRLGSGHRIITLCDKNYQEKHLIHRLVLEAFVGPCPEGMEGCHYPDRDPGNNRLENLRWDTPKANATDAIKHGTRKCGSDSYQSKLTESGVVEARKVYDKLGTYSCLRSIAKKYGVSVQSVHSAVKRKTWKHVR